jgi:hypothetical protein
MSKLTEQQKTEFINGLNSDIQIFEATAGIYINKLSKIHNETDKTRILNKIKIIEYPIKLLKQQKKYVIDNGFIDDDLFDKTNYIMALCYKFFE